MCGGRGGGGCGWRSGGVAADAAAGAERDTDAGFEAAGGVSLLPESWGGCSGGALRTFNALGDNCDIIEFICDIELMVSGFLVWGGIFLI